MTENFIKFDDSYYNLKLIKEIGIKNKTYYIRMIHSKKKNVEYFDEDLEIASRCPSNEFVDFWNSLRSGTNSEKFIGFDGYSSYYDSYYNLRLIKEIGVNNGIYYIRMIDSKRNDNEDFNEDLEIATRYPSNDFFDLWNSLKSRTNLEHENKNQKLMNKITKLEEKCLELENQKLMNKITKLEEKCLELENQIKFLPIVSQEYQNAKEHFNQKNT